MSSTIVVSVPLGIDLRLSTLHIQNQLGGSGNAGFGVEGRIVYKKLGWYNACSSAA